MKKLNIKHILVICVTIILSLTLVSGCIFVIPGTEDWFTPPSVEEPPPTTTPPDSTPIAPDWTPPPPSESKPPLPDYVSVVAKVKPSVVAITTDTGAGSGWIISEDGIIVTNNHVVAGTQTVALTLDDGRIFSAKEVRGDALTDLAIVKVDAQNLPAADIGDCSALQVGQSVAAIGNALGLGIRMTGGWISRLEVSLPISAGQTLDDLIETDAAINPGNSGGPLVNMAGEVIGITSVKVAQVGVEGLGYAISMTKAKDIIDQLIIRGYVIRTYLGIGLSDINPVIAFLQNLAVDKGALITFVAPDGPAAEAGLEEGDIIIGLDDEEITTAQELINGIHARQIGQEIKIVYWRGDTENTTYTTLTESPPPSP